VGMEREVVVERRWVLKKKGVGGKKMDIGFNQWHSVK
jgi:hypothetical protein